MPLKGLLGRLKRGRIAQVLLVYLGACWVVIEVVATLRELLTLPQWMGPVTVVLLLVGLVVVAATAWVQSHPLTAQKESTGELPRDWELNFGDLLRSLKAGRLPHLNWGRVVGAGVVSLSLLVGVAGGYVLLRDRAATANRLEIPEGGFAVAVMPFAQSGPVSDAVLGEGVMDLIASNLDAITGLRAISPRSLQSKNTSDGSDARVLEVARSVHAAYVVTGSVTTVGNQLRVHAEVRDVATGNRIGAPAQADGMSAGLLQLVDRLSVQLATMMLQGDPEFAPGFRPSISLTGSPAALRSYLEGESSFRRLDFPSALGAYERALQADSTFALAWSRKALALGWVQQGSPDIQTALHNALRDPKRLPERDRLLIEGLLAGQEGNYAALPALVSATSRYPDDPALWNALAEFYVHHGPDKMIGLRPTYDALLEAVRLQPDFYPNYIHTIEYSIMLNDTARSRELLAASASQLAHENAIALHLAHDLAFGDGESALNAVHTVDTLRTPGTTLEAALTLPRLLEFKERHVRVQHTGPAASARSARILLTTLAVRGKLQEAVTLLHDRRLPPRWHAGLAYMLRAMGAPAPRNDWKLYLALARTDTTLTGQLVFVAAYAAEQDDSATYARALAHIRTQERLRVERGDSAQLKIIRARLNATEGIGAWRRGDLTGARRLFEASLPDALWPVGGMVRWWLAEVLLALGQDDEALRYYESLRAMDGDWNEFPLRHDRIAGIHERHGRTAQARASLEELLLIWKDAEPDNAALAHARARLDRLR